MQEEGDTGGRGDRRRAGGGSLTVLADGYKGRARGPVGTNATASPTADASVGASSVHFDIWPVRGAAPDPSEVHKPVLGDS